eukprot:1155134-Pelagomonas_calceolata.AAC.7
MHGNISPGPYANVLSKPLALLPNSFPGLLGSWIIRVRKVADRDAKKNPPNRARWHTRAPPEWQQGALISRCKGQSGIALKQGYLGLYRGQAKEVEEKALPTSAVCEEGCEHQGLNSHELDEDVERGAGGILEWVTHLHHKRV